MLSKRPAKAVQKISVAVIAGVTGLGTMFSIMPASFADTLPSNNGSQSVISKDIGSEVKISGLQRAQTTLISISKMSSNTSLAPDATGYQTQAKQEDLAKSLSALLSSLEGVLHATPYSSKLSAIQSSLEGIENTLKSPNLTNSDLEGATKTQGQLQELVKQLQAIIDEASAQYGAEIKNAIGDYDASNLLSVETGASDAVKAEQSVYGTANMANNPNLSSANGTFSANAADASASAGTASSSSSLVGSAEVMEQNANAQLDNIQDESNALYDGSASPATGVLATDAQNFDSWAQSWISARNVSSDSQTGYGPYLTALNNAISEIEAGEKDGSLTVQNKTDADTVLTNLKIMQSAVTTLQSEAGSDLASKTPEEAYSLAQQYGLGANPTMHQLQTFIKDMLPVTGSGSAGGGKSGTVPEAVSTYGGTSYGAWPKDNPFGGSDAKTLWGNLSKLQADAAKMPTWGSGPSGNWTSSWGQNVSNYEYLQAVQPYAETITFDSTQVLSAAQDAAAKIQAAKQLADQNTSGAASDAAAAAQVKADIQSALTDIDNAASYGSSLVQAADGAYSQYSSATASSNPTVTIPYLLAPGGKSATKTVSLPTQTNESPLYAQSALKQMDSNFTDAIKQAYQSLSGSTLGNGAGGLLGDATAWQKAIVTQGVLDNAQKAYNDIQKVQQDLNNVKSAADPGAAIDSLNQLQRDLTPLINDTQAAVNAMKSGNQTIEGLGLTAPYSQADISDAQASLTAAMPLASASTADNPIQKAIVNGNDYNFAHPIVVGMDNLQPTITALIGQGAEPGLAQKILALPFQAMPASDMSASPMASGGRVQVQGAKAASDLASTGSDAAAAAIGAAVLLAAGVAAEVLKKKGAKENR